jgi:hypothetical protein
MRIKQYRIFEFLNLILTTLNLCEFGARSSRRAMLELWALESYLLLLSPINM